MSNWNIKLLDEVVEYFIDYRGKTPSKVGAGIPLVTAKIVKNGRIVTPSEFISIEDYPKWMTRGYPEIDDVVLTTEAPLGEVALIKNKDIALAQRIITLRGYKDLLDNRFLKYWLQSELGQYELESRASGTTVFGIKSSVLKKIPITLPGINEQKTIASVLLSLDDKIDLLHRQNKTLESMAETLFRQWFVEAAQEDWEEYSVEDIASHIKNSIKPNELSEELFHHYSLPAYDNGLNATIDYGRDILSGKYKVESNSILVSKLNPRFPRVWLINEAKNNSICSTEFQNIKPKDKSNVLFLYSLFKSRQVTDELAMSASGTSGSHQRVRPEDLMKITFQIPNSEKMLEYSALVDPLLSKVDTNRHNIQSLESLRDTLLPKLMSGEVRVQYEES